MGYEYVPMYPHAQREFEKWLVENKGLRREVRFCKTCKWRESCGHKHNGGCIRLFNRRREVLRRNLPFGEMFSEYFVDWAYTNEGNLKRNLWVALRFGFDWLELLQEKAGVYSWKEVR